MIALCLTLASCAPMMKSLTRSGAESPAAERCGACHVAIYQEWKSSKHAAAFTSPAFTADTLDHQIQSCLPCHAPGSIFISKLETRSWRRNDGVDCLACHLVEGKQHGPYKPGAMTPHATQTDPTRYRDGALCGKCHAGVFRQWQEQHTRDGALRTCQQCHMARVQRKLTQATDLLSKGIVALHEEHETGRHDCSAAIRPEGGAVQIEIDADAGDCVVKVKNNLPHSIPAGDFGTRAVRLSAQALDESGRPLDTASKELVKDLKTQLDPGRTMELRLKCSSPSATRINVRLERLRPDGTTAYAIAEGTKDLDAGKVGMP